MSEVESQRHPTGGSVAYPQYVRHLEKLARQNSAGMDDFARGYFDWLQAPLQPLMDDLQSSVYEVFEKDPVKYRNYEEAVFAALSDRPPNDVQCVRTADRFRSRCLLIVFDLQGHLHLWSGSRTSGVGRPARSRPLEALGTSLRCREERQRLHHVSP